MLTYEYLHAIIQKLTRERIDLEIQERSIRDKKLFLTNLYRFDKIYKLSRRTKRHELDN